MSFLYNNNLVVKEEWTIVNSLHLTHLMHNSKRVSNCSHFPLFKFCLIHNFNHITNNSRPMFHVKTLKFKAIVLVWSFSTPLARPPKEFLISSSDEFEDVDLARDDVLFNIITIFVNLRLSLVSN